MTFGSTTTFPTDFREVQESEASTEKDDEDYGERSASVEDESAKIIKSQTLVEELQSLLRSKFNTESPIYTYFAVNDDEVVSTVQLWSGMRFSSHPQKTRSKAMEEAAFEALGYLKSVIQDPSFMQSASLPNDAPYVVTLRNTPSTHVAPHSSHALPVTYATAPHGYCYPSQPYTMMPTRSVLTIPQDYNTPAMIQPPYGVGPAYAQYVQYPYWAVQMSPTHQGKQPQLSSYPHPSMWNYYPRNNIPVKNKSEAPITEFKILDKPPVLHKSGTKPSGDENSGGGRKESVATDHINAEETRTIKTASRPSSAKAKLAISFNQGSK